MGGGNDQASQRRSLVCYLKGLHFIAALGFHNIDMSRDVKIAWAKGQNGQPVHIKDASNGKGCLCTCFECAEPLIAVQSKTGRRAWHYSHESHTKCSGMSALHYVAQQIIVDRVGESMAIPGLSVSINDTDFLNNDVCFGKDISPTKIRFSSAVKETRVGNKIVDVFCSEASGDIVAFEVCVTHAKTTADIQYFNEQGLRVVEIDLSHMPWDASFKEIQHAVLHNPETRAFIAHPLKLEAEKQYAQWQSEHHQRFFQYVHSYAQTSHEVSFSYSREFGTNLYSYLFEKTVPLTLSKAISEIHKEDDDMYWYEARLQNDSVVRVLFTIHKYGYVEPSFNWDVPTLVNPGFEHMFTDSDGFDWHRVHKWNLKMEQEGKREYEKHRESINDSIKVSVPNFLR